MKILSPQVSLVYLHRDCLRFSFIGILQNELDELRSMWNSHLIRHARSRVHISGIPEELYHLPELQGAHGIQFPCHTKI